MLAKYLLFQYKLIVKRSSRVCRSSHRSIYCSIRVAKKAHKVPDDYKYVRNRTHPREVLADLAPNMGIFSGRDSCMGEIV